MTFLASIVLSSDIHTWVAYFQAFLFSSETLRKYFVPASYRILCNTVFVIVGFQGFFCFLVATFVNLFLRSDQTVTYLIILYCVVLLCIILCLIISYYSIPYCIVLYCTILYQQYDGNLCISHLSPFAESSAWGNNSVCRKYPAHCFQSQGSKPAQTEDNVISMLLCWRGGVYAREMKSYQCQATNKTRLNKTNKSLLT